MHKHNFGEYQTPVRSSARSEQRQGLPGAVIPGISRIWMCSTLKTFQILFIFQLTLFCGIGNPLSSEISTSCASLSYKNLLRGIWILREQRDKIFLRH